MCKSASEAPYVVFLQRLVGSSGDMRDLWPAHMGDKKLSEGWKDGLRYKKEGV